MTNGPAATVGQVLELPFERPRRRKDILEHADYYEFRGALIAFLEKQEARKAVRGQRMPASPAQRSHSHNDSLNDPNAKSSLLSAGASA